MSELDTCARQPVDCVRRRLLQSLALAAFAQAAPTWAAEGTGKTVRIVVPFSPGGGNDILARFVATRLAGMLGENFIVENKPGAGGNIGSALVATGPADGANLLMASSQSVINPSLYARVGFDVLKDLVPVANVANVQFLVVAHPSAKVRTIAELVAADKRDPGTMNHGTPGNGTPQHLAAELFNRMAGTKLRHIPYKGTAPAMADLLGGQLQLAFATLPSVATYVKAGTLVPLAVTGAKRSPLFPSVPTVAEAGVPGYEAGTWYSLLAQAATPAPVLSRLSNALSALLSQTPIQLELRAMGFEAAFKTSSEMRRVMAAELVQWRDLIRTSGIRLD